MTDTRGEHERFGKTRLRELLTAQAGCAPDQLLAALDAALGMFQAGPQADDTAAVAVAPAPLRTAGGGGSGEPPLAINTT